MIARLLAAVVLALLLPACTTAPVQRGSRVDAQAVEQRQLERERLLGEQGFAFTGRIAVIDGKDGGSGRIEWVSHPRPFLSVAISAPITRQTWRLFADGEGARIEGLEGGTRYGADTESLLREATGWNIPVAALNDWVRALRAPGFPVEGVEWDERGGIRRLRQDGWTIDYQWPDKATATPEMPRRIDAVKGEARIKLIIDQWTQP